MFSGFCLAFLDEKKASDWFFGWHCIDTLGLFVHNENVYIYIYTNIPKK